MKRMRGWMAIGMVGLLMGGGFLAFPSALFAQGKTIVWNIPHTVAPIYYHILDLKLFADKVEVTEYINYWFIQGASIEFLGGNKKALNFLPQGL